MKVCKPCTIGLQEIISSKPFIDLDQTLAGCLTLATVTTNNEQDISRLAAIWQSQSDRGHMTVRIKQLNQDLQLAKLNPRNKLNKMNKESMFSPLVACLKFEIELGLDLNNEIKPPFLVDIKKYIILHDAPSSKTQKIDECSLVKFCPSRICLFPPVFLHDASTAVMLSSHLVGSNVRTYFLTLGSISTRLCNVGLHSFRLT